MSAPSFTDGPDVAPDFHRGERIGRYEVLTQLSIGGMAELLLAFTSGPGGFRKFVVIKRILPDVQGNDEFVRMFLDEARITASFSHPNICTVFDLGESDEGLYLAMEFLAGQNLNQLQNACLAKQRPLPVGLVARIGRDVCHALHYAHTFVGPTGKPSPVIHRDVAEKNVFVTYAGAVKLLDFGIAKAKGSLGRTERGMVKGTTGYMAPEQVEDGPLDGRSDLFSLGVVLHELLTGQRLFAAETEDEELEKILRAKVIRPDLFAPHVPAALADVVMKALERRPEDRFATAQAMARAIEHACGPLLFDETATRELMGELFAEKMEATFAMLEAADVREQTQTFLRAVRAVKRDDGQIFVERPTDKTPVPPTRSVGLPVLELPPPESAPSEEQDRPGAIGWRAIVGGVAAVCVLLGAIAIGGPWLFPGVASPPSMPGEMTDLPSGAPRPVPVASAGVKPEPRPPSVAPRGSGKLTLLLDAEALVRRKGELLGPAPLWNVALPAGDQRLELEGADGTHRVLVAPIRAGKTLTLNLVWKDLPRR